jgi:hypothetical protein
MGANVWLEKCLHHAFLFFSGLKKHLQQLYKLKDSTHPPPHNDFYSLNMKEGHLYKLTRITHVQGCLTHA